jgi:GntR family transcriptional regulator
LQAQESILRRIGDGSYPPGSKLPPEVDLAVTERVSRHTLRRALANLEIMGRIERSHGGGTFVARPRPVVEISLDDYESLHPHLARRQGYTSRLAGVSITRKRVDPPIEQRLGVEPGTPATNVSFLVEVEETPMAYFDFFAPQDAVTVGEMRLGFSDSIIEFFDGCGGRARLDSYRMEVREVRAEQDLARRLSVSIGRTLFLFDGELFDQADDLIGISMGYFVPDCVRITVDRRAVVHEHLEPCP